MHMEDVVAIKLTDDRNRRHFFLTWGRVFDSTDPRPLLHAVRLNVRQFGIRQVRAIAVCKTLGAAASQPYFYEALLAFSCEKIPVGKAFKKWKSARRKRIETGKEIYFLGSPGRRTK